MQYVTVKKRDLPCSGAVFSVHGSDGSGDSSQELTPRFRNADTIIVAAQESFFEHRQLHWLYLFGILGMNDTVAHQHSFLPETWPFDSAQDCAAFTTKRFWRSHLPVLRAFHCPNGDWQFFDGDIADDDECLMVCLGCFYERDKSIGILGELPRGWSASREKAESPWECEPYEE